MKAFDRDYKNFKFSRINEPEFRHSYLWLTWLVYFAFYFLTENFIPVEKCHPMHNFLDDLIPFNEYFLIFYCSWFLLVLGSLVYLFLYDVKSFKKLQWFIVITQIIAMTAYILYPSRQDLRPEVFVRDNVFTHLMAFIYTFDTSTGVCPSLHVAYSLGIYSVWSKKEDVKGIWKAVLLVWIVCICLSTAFVKQHSMVDVLWALPTGLVAEIILYWKDFWLPKFKKA